MEVTNAISLIKFIALIESLHFSERESGGLRVTKLHFLLILIFS